MSKTLKHLYEQLTDRDLITVAAKNALQYKLCRSELNGLLENGALKPEIIDDILKSLEDETFRPSKFTEMEITDTPSGKTRNIFIPTLVPDHIIHWAVIMILEPFFTRHFYEHSYGSIPGRGINSAVKYIKHKINKDNRREHADNGRKRRSANCLQIDIKQFYPSINREILFEKFKSDIKDKQFLNLLEMLIWPEDYYEDAMPEYNDEGSIIHSNSHGLFIGTYYSQWFCNYYLTSFDYHVMQDLKKEYRIYAYVRYVDDCIFLASSKSRLHAFRKEIDGYLRNTLDLQIKENWQVFPLAKRRLDFLGYLFGIHDTKLRHRNFQALVVQSLKLDRYIRNGVEITPHEAKSFMSRVGMTKMCDGYNISEKYIKLTTVYICITIASESDRLEGLKYSDPDRYYAEKAVIINKKRFYEKYGSYGRNLYYKDLYDHYITQFYTLYDSPDYNVWALMHNSVNISKPGKHYKPKKQTTKKKPNREELYKKQIKEPKEPNETEDIIE